MDDPPPETRALTARGTLMPEAKSTPRLNPLLVAHQIEVEDENRRFEHENMWTSCCGARMDRRGVVYFAQLGISVGLASFCIAMMATDPSCDTFSKFSPLLTLIAGVYLPTPSLKSDS